MSDIVRKKVDRVRLKRDVLLHLDFDRLPPIAFGLLLGALAAARQVNKFRAHGRALKAGNHAMRHERRTHAGHINRSILHSEGAPIKRPSLGKSIKRAGSRGYQRSMERQSQGAGENVVLEIATKRLLDLARVGRTTYMFKKLPDLLDALTEPIRARILLPAPIVEWRKLEGGRWRIVVAGSWVWAIAPYHSLVQHPLPLRSPHAVKLILRMYAEHSAWRSKTPTSVKFDTFTDWLGIDSKQHRAWQRKTANRAITIANRYLKSLTAAGALTQPWQIRLHENKDRVRVELYSTYRPKPTLNRPIAAPRKPDVVPHIEPTFILEPEPQQQYSEAEFRALAIRGWSGFQDFQKRKEQTYD